MPVFQGGEYQEGAILQEDVADYYGIPSIHLGVAVRELVSESKLVFTAQAEEETPRVAVFTHDGVHPTVPDGHRIYSDTIIANRYPGQMLQIGCLWNGSYPR
ncbi:hypothetical protein GC102_09685 [Paenibacillus sp. LMG 31460]|uniref:Uncharacterized protein n=1 Tax=Paenibacillus germinis TaxID=2654979 RepID=A0ABX1Z1Q8_9BACL|nr:hypothetical protein [Paenibacillus germinis]NOU86044.1 hypothetical protein [Paenibacillus germinis]